MNNKDFIRAKNLSNNPHTVLNLTHTPSYVGRYELGSLECNVAISLKKKPKWFHRTMMKLFFGIIWKDN